MHTKKSTKVDELFCNNCGKRRHLSYQCRIPITSNGIIAVRKCKVDNENEFQYLMIRRKDSLGYLDFLRCRFNIYQKRYIINMLKQMTNYEKELLRSKYNVTRSNLYNTQKMRDKITQLIYGVRHKDGFYDLKTLLDESDECTTWEEPEWGFPKGRRNDGESDYECAIREFMEETGYPRSSLKDISNIMPVQEIFTGSNYFSYKHKYYIMYIDYVDSNNRKAFQKSEVSDIGWGNVNECIKKIRDYNLEKRDIVTKINKCLSETQLVYLT